MNPVFLQATLLLVFVSVFGITVSEVKLNVGSNATVVALDGESKDPSPDMVWKPRRCDGDYDVLKWRYEPCRTGQLCGAPGNGTLFKTTLEFRPWNERFLDKVYFSLVDLDGEVLATSELIPIAGVQEVQANRVYSLSVDFGVEDFKGQGRLGFLIFYRSSSYYCVWAYFDFSNKK